MSNYCMALARYEDVNIAKMFREIPDYPRRARIKLIGAYDLGDLTRQVQEKAPGIELAEGLAHEFDIRDPTNDLVAQIYLQQSRLRKLGWQMKLKEEHSGRNLAIVEVEWKIIDTDVFTGISLKGTTSGADLAISVGSKIRSYEPSFVRKMIYALDPDANLASR